MASLFKPWGEGAGLSVVTADPGSPETEFPGEQVRLAAVVLGAVSLGEEAGAAQFTRVKGLCPDAALVVISAVDDPVEAVRALEAGADGLLPAALAPEAAINALGFILRGGVFVPPEALRAVTDAGRGPGEGRARTVGPRQDLTPRQQDVLELLSRGLSNKIIARELDMQESTVKVHVRQIMHKLGVSNRTQVALIAVAGGEAPTDAPEVPAETAGEAFRAASERVAEELRLTDGGPAERPMLRHALKLRRGGVDGMVSVRLEG
jgi:DNA-binding NarL/FixJ family response regulator